MSMYKLIEGLSMLNEEKGKYDMQCRLKKKKRNMCLLTDSARNSDRRKEKPKRNLRSTAAYHLAIAPAKAGAGIRRKLRIAAAICGAAAKTRMAETERRSSFRAAKTA